MKVTSNKKDVSPNKYIPMNVKRELKRIFQNRRRGNMNHARVNELELEKAEAMEFLQTCARMMQADIEIGNRENPMGGNFVKDALQRVRELDELIIKEKTQ